MRDGTCRSIVVGDRLESGGHIARSAVVHRELGECRATVVVARQRCDKPLGYDHVVGGEANVLGHTVAVVVVVLRRDVVVGGKQRLAHREGGVVRHREAIARAVLFVIRVHRAVAVVSRIGGVGHSFGVGAVVRIGVGGTGARRMHERLGSKGRARMIEAPVQTRGRGHVGMHDARTVRTAPVAQGEGAINPRADGERVERIAMGMRSAPVPFRYLAVALEVAG